MRLLEIAAKSEDPQRGFVFPDSIGQVLEEQEAFGLPLAKTCSLAELTGKIPISRRAVLGTLAADIVSSIPLFQARPRVGLSETNARKAEIVYSGPTDKPEVALTVDDCFDLEAADHMAGVAAESGFRVTFFPVGSAICRDRDFWREVVGMGHELGNHTWSHAYLDVDAIGEAGIREQIARANEEIVAVTGFLPKAFRPPGMYGFTPGVNRQYRDWLCGIIFESGIPDVALWNVDTCT